MKPFGPNNDLPFVLLVRHHHRSIVSAFLTAVEDSIQRELLLWRNSLNWNILHEAASRSDLEILSLLGVVNSTSHSISSHLLILDSH